MVHDLPRRFAMILGLLCIGALAASCSDIDVAAGMDGIVQERSASEAAAQAEIDAAAEAESQAESTAAHEAAVAEADVIAQAEAEAAAAAQAAADAVNPPDTSDSGEDTTSSSNSGSETAIAGQEAVVTTGSWTVAQVDVGVRLRALPAGEILGFIVQGDVVRTTGRGRVLNNVSWGEVEMPDATVGWMVLEHLEAIQSAGAQSSDPSSDSAGETAADNSDDSPPDFETDGLVAMQVVVQQAFVSDRTDGLEVRNEPRADGELLTTADPGSEVDIVSTNAWRSDDVPFVHVRIGDVRGWVDGRLLDVDG